MRMYDTSNPYNWRHYKTVSYPFGRWTLTDADLSPDNKWLAYTSLASIVCLAPTNPNDTGDPYALDLGYRTATSRSDFPIYSARFSGDGRNIVGFRFGARTPSAPWYALSPSFSASGYCPATPLSS